jgi:hypothetical protein
LEEQIRLNRLIVRRRIEFQALIKRVKVLETREAKLGKQVDSIDP